MRAELQCAVYQKEKHLELFGKHITLFTSRQRKWDGT